MNVAIVGVGGFGVRHLQGAARIDKSVSIYAVDASPASLDRAKLCIEGLSCKRVKYIKYLYRVDQLPHDIDVAIVATSSVPRKKIAMDLLRHCNVTHLVLEKVLFPTVNDYYEVSSFLEQYPNSKAWVNCPRRMSEFYFMLKEIINNEPIDCFQVDGTEWGLGCNSIHMVDLLAFCWATQRILRLSRLYWTRVMSVVSVRGILNSQGRCWAKLANVH